MLHRFIDAALPAWQELEGVCLPVLGAHKGSILTTSTTQVLNAQCIICIHHPVTSKACSLGHRTGQRDTAAHCIQMPNIGRKGECLHTSGALKTVNQ